jgi:hypothetical protein
LEDFYMRCALNVARSISLAATGILLVAGVAPGQEQEKKIQRSALPPAVEKTVTAQSEGATVRGFAEEKENGETFYEAQLMVSGHSKDVLIAKDGTVVEVEEQALLDSLPPAIREGLQAKAGSGKITKVETLTKKDKLVAYEAQVVSSGKKSEVQVGPDGKPLDHEE